MYSDDDDIISPGFKLGVDTIASKTWFHMMSYCGCCLTSSVSFFFVSYMFVFVSYI